MPLRTLHYFFCERKIRTLTSHKWDNQEDLANTMYHYTRPADQSMIKILFSEFEAIVLSWKHAVQAHKPVLMASKFIMAHIKGSVSQYPILEIQSSQTA